MIRWAVPLAVSAVLVSVAIHHAGRGAAVTVLALVLLEAALSFDNAVVNAVILRTMSPFWQRMFLTVGVVVAVLGVRLAMPLLVVAANARTSPTRVLDLMIHDPHSYTALVRQARGGLAAFGATFLTLVTAGFFGRPAGRRWLPWEKALAAVLGRRGMRGAALLLGVVLLGGSLVAGRTAVAVGLLAGLVVWGALRVLERRAAAPGVVGAGGFAAFLALEAIDASVSVDGVLGAFAITTDILLVAVGLGIGALFVRTLTVTLVRSGTMAELPYLEHGAYYAIAMLALVLGISGLVTVPDVALGTVEGAIIGAALLASRRVRAVTTGGVVAA